MPKASASPRKPPFSSSAANASRVPSRRAASYIPSHSRSHPGGGGSGMRVKRSTSGSPSMAATAGRCASLKGSKRTALGRRLSADQPALDRELCELHGVQRGALQQVVADHEEVEHPRVGQIALDTSNDRIVEP